ncbi:hypothetical protein AWL63_04080 [Sphingomonas panacis]|uniref:Uncharacterized protein n=1 Tax=Sphingomonas panacis TaxID=1560345 RepID=A0A1B3Z761_9SPHN|nr:hypothetical protein [Sphingomonas panacis]AOH83271.1 hypothetical protein AWL63_04080 [Sphingomonas panacis]
MTWKTYLIAQALGVAAFNAVCNAGYTAYLWQAPVLPLETIGADLAMTPIWIGLLSVLLGTPFVRKALAGGRMMEEAGLRAPRLAKMLPRNLVLRAITAAALCAVLFSLPLALLMPALGDGLLTQADAIGGKVILTIAFSLILVPLVAYATIADMPATEATRA